MRIKFFIVFLVSFPLSLFANCENINLLTEKNSPFNEIPVYNQDGLGSCYAYAAAQLIDYARFKKGVRVSGPINPVWLAFNYALNESKASIEGGGAKLAINYVKEKGFCDPRVVGKAFEKYKKGNNITDAEFANLIETIHEVWGDPKNTTTNDVYNNAVNSCYAGQRIKNSLFEDIFSAFEVQNGKFSKVIPTILLGEFFLEVCSGNNNIKLDVGQAVSTCLKCDDQDIQKEMNKILKSKNPVGISYCASVLNNKNFRGLSKERNEFYSLFRDIRASYINEPSEKKNTKECGNHASLIVASRNKGGKCQYLLRNSWGAVSYKNHPDCLCEVSKGKFVDCKHGDGKPNKVGCWINSENLIPNVYNITHIEE